MSLLLLAVFGHFAATVAEKTESCHTLPSGDTLCGARPSDTSKGTLLVQKKQTIVKDNIAASQKFDKVSLQEEVGASEKHEDLDAALQTCSRFEKQFEIDVCVAHFHALSSAGAQGELVHEAEVLHTYFAGASAPELQEALLQRARVMRANRSATSSLNDALRIKGPGQTCAMSGSRGRDAITWPCDAHHKCFDANLASPTVVGKCVRADLLCKQYRGEKPPGKCKELCHNVEDRVLGFGSNLCPAPGGHGVRSHTPGNRAGATCATIYARRGDMQNCWAFMEKHDCEISNDYVTCLPRKEGGHCQGCTGNQDGAGDYDTSVYPCWPAAKAMGSGVFKCRAYRTDYEKYGF